MEKGFILSYSARVQSIMVGNLKQLKLKTGDHIARIIWKLRDMNVWTWIFFFPFLCSQGLMSGDGATHSW